MKIYLHSIQKRMKRKKFSNCLLFESGRLNDLLSNLPGRYGLQPTSFISPLSPKPTLISDMRFQGYISHGTLLMSILKSVTVLCGVEWCSPKRYWCLFKLLSVRHRVSYQTGRKFMKCWAQNITNVGCGPSIIHLSYFFPSVCKMSVVLIHFSLMKTKMFFLSFKIRSEAQ